MERDWSSLARLAVSVLLVTSPYWLLSHAGEPAYESEADEIEYREGVAGYLRAD
jgi:hypothetical protein